MVGSESCLTEDGPTASRVGETSWMLVTVIGGWGVGNGEMEPCMESQGADMLMGEMTVGRSTDARLGVGCR